MAEARVAGRTQLDASLELLRRFEPVVAYTAGEMFFPTAVEGYVRRCSLWRRGEDGRSEQLVPAGLLDLNGLVRHGQEEANSLLSLRFVEKPIGAAEYRDWAKTRPHFAARGRLARVGLAARFVNAIFYLTLLLRGRVPGGTTGAADRQYEAIRAEHPGYVYHGRVTREEGYVVLNYQFFHAMNDWRSSFFGVNDHEADWEQIFVYLVEDGIEDLRPAWVAYASHDFEGDDLRRRWDDPDLTKVGNHPVVYSGAGSHSSYFKPGDYLVSVDIKFLQPLGALTRFLTRFWRDVLGQGDPEGLAKGVASLISVPFVDYARGDGVTIGPGQQGEWTPVVIDEDVPWVGDFRGLWGLDTHDPFAGELAPAGPMYNRNGSVRETWFDPVGWAGLSKEPLPDEREATLAARMDELRTEIIGLDRDTVLLEQELPRLRVEVQALGGFGSQAAMRKRREEELTGLERKLSGFKTKREELVVSFRACDRYRRRLEAGYREPPQAHVRHRVEPASAEYFRAGRLAELWAAASTGLLLLFAVALIVAGVHELSAVIIVVLGAVLVDSILTGTVIRFLLNLTITLAVISTVVLAYTFFWQLALIVIAAIGLLILTANLKELRAR
ncbi:MAG: hypothetical protein AB7T32_07120 [Dehalococcoidia bacterium]